MAGYQGAITRLLVIITSADYYYSLQFHLPHDCYILLLLYTLLPYKQYFPFLLCKYMELSYTWNLYQRMSYTVNNITQFENDT